MIKRRRSHASRLSPRVGTADQPGQTDPVDRLRDAFGRAPERAVARLRRNLDVEGTRALLALAAIGDADAKQHVAAICAALDLGRSSDVAATAQLAAGFVDQQVGVAAEMAGLEDAQGSPWYPATTREDAVDKAPSEGHGLVPGLRQDVVRQVVKPARLTA